MNMYVYRLNNCNHKIQNTIHKSSYKNEKKFITRSLKNCMGEHHFGLIQHFKAQLLWLWYLIIDKRVVKYKSP